MKILNIYIVLFVFAMLLTSAKAYGDTAANNSAPVPKVLKLRKVKDIPYVSLELKDVQKPAIKISEPPKKIDNEIFVTDQEKIKNAFEIQKKMDIDDITVLWESTVERNAVIKFALKKLAMPPDQRRIHSSLMAKSVSALISGVSILPNFLGADGFTSSASMAGGSLASRVVNSKTFPKDLPLTDTELIQLASLVEDLQDKLIKSYYDYKSEIDALKECRQNLLLQNKNYSQALKSNNQLSILASSALYDKELLNELRHKQQIKQYRLDLERLAGAESVDKLNLTKMTSFNCKDIGINTKGDNKSDVMGNDKGTNSDEKK